MPEEEFGPVWASVWSRPQSRAGGASYGGLIFALRRFLAAFAGARFCQDFAKTLTKHLDEYSAILIASVVDEGEQIYAQRPDLDGRGQATSPAIRFTELGPSHLSGVVTFDRFFLGSNGAAHGGAIAFMFDEAAGRLAHLNRRETARTAYLNTRYRSIAPIDVELFVSGHIVREEGRKRFLHLELRQGDIVCAEADVLMVALRPGQT